MAKKEKSCGIVVVTEDEKYLLIRHLAGHWDFPKGHVEKDETEEETALREVEEETGLKARIIPGFRESLNYLVKGHIPKEVIYFFGRPESGQLTPQVEEVMEVGFFSFEESLEKITFSSNRALLHMARDFYQKLEEYKNTNDK